MGTKLETVLRLLDELPSAELKRARDYAGLRLSHGLAGGGIKTSRQESFAHEVLTMIADECHRRGIDVRASSKRLATNKGFPAFKAKMHDHGEVGGFLKKASERSRVRLRALTRVAVHELVDNMLGMGVAVSATTLMSNIHRIPAVLDRAFPGYAAAGLLQLAVRKEDEDVR